MIEEEEKETAEVEEPIPDDNGESVEEEIEEVLSEFSITEAVTDGANLVEEFSPHGTAKFVGQSMRLSEKVVKYVFAVIYVALGIACIVATEHILHVLSYIVGSFMAVIGVAQLVFAVINKEYARTDSNKTAGSLILIALSVMILIDQDWADTFIPIVWGVIGLMEAAHAFNHAFSRIARGMRCSYYLVKGIIEVVLAFLLLYEPAHHITLHIIVFGVNLVFDGIIMLPILKKWTAVK